MAAPGSAANARSAAAKRQRGSVDADQIVATALEIVNKDGLSALTMRGLANELGIGVMTLYGHVRTKEELVERIAELAVTELEIPDEGTWNERLFELFKNVREMLWRHPAVLYADTVQPLSGPGALRAANASLGMLREGGLDDEAAVRGMSALLSYTFGSAMFRLNQAGDGRRDYQLHVRGADPEQLPHVSALAPHLLERGSDAEFESGLRILVKGLAQQKKQGGRKK